MTLGVTYLLISVEFFHALYFL